MSALGPAILAEGGTGGGDGGDRVWVPVLRAGRPEAGAVARALIASAEAVKESRNSPSREQAIKIDGRVALRLQRRDGRLTLKFYQLDKRAQREITEEILELAERRVRERMKGEP